jgi:hypothetical protein
VKPRWEASGLSCSRNRAWAQARRNHVQCRHVPRIDLLGHKPDHRKPFPFPALQLNPGSPRPDRNPPASARYPPPDGQTRAQWNSGAKKRLAWNSAEVSQIRRFHSAWFSLGVASAPGRLVRIERRCRTMRGGCHDRSTSARAKLCLSALYACSQSAPPKFPAAREGGLSIIALEQPSSWIGSPGSPAGESSVPSAGLPNTAAVPADTSARGPDWFTFFLSDVQTGFGPFVSIYLTTRCAAATEQRASSAPARSCLNWSSSASHRLSDALPIRGDGGHY